MDDESISQNIYSDGDVDATTSDEGSVEEVIDAISNPQSGYSDHSDASTDMIVDSALSNTDDAHASWNETEKFNDDDSDLGDVHEHSVSHYRYPRSTWWAMQCW